jgi:hypothetical protein
MPLTAAQTMDLFILTELPAIQANIDLVTQAIARIENQLGAGAIAQLTAVLDQATTINSTIYTNPTNGMTKADVIEWEKGGGAFAANKTALAGLSKKLLRILGLDWLKQQDNKVDLGCGGVGGVPAWYNPVGY